MGRGSEIPYQLRPNKFIDRMLFLDFMQRITSIRGTKGYAYISMGGKHLTDQHLVYRKTGISKLFSFDFDAETVKRQRCNLPIDTAICEQMNSSEIPGSLDLILSLFEGSTNFICWLDYTVPGERHRQLEEFKSVLKNALPGDVVRISMNANARTLEKNPSEWKEEGFATPGLFRAKKLQDQLGGFFPSSIKTISETDLPAALLEAVRLVCDQANAEMKKCSYWLCLATTYQDGQKMFTATIFATEAGTVPPAGISNWEFYPDSDDDFVSIAAPILSVREKHMIDQYISEDSASILDKIEFQPTDKKDHAAAIESYKILHRFYPEFQHVEVI